MPQEIFFNTNFINPRLYKRFIRAFVYDNLGKDAYHGFINTWKISIYPDYRASEDPHFHGQNGIGGVTGMNTIRLYIRDEPTNNNDIFKRAFRENAVVITHELAHAMMIHKNLTWKVKLRHDDYSGHKAGQQLNYSTAEVHDRHTENKFWTMNFWFWDWKTFIPMKLSCRVLEVRDIVGIL